MTALQKLKGNSDAFARSHFFQDDHGQNNVDNNSIS